MRGHLALSILAAPIRHGLALRAVPPVLAGLAVLAVVACNGGGGPPAPASMAPSVQRSADEAQVPKGDPQKTLPIGQVVLEAAPLAPLTLTVEVADDDDERRQGLMFRRTMADDAGMLFLFPSERQQSFWMRNTLLPLDMFFIDSDWKVVGVAENTEPLTDSPRSVEGKSQYVLEVNAGFAAKHGFGAGTQVRFTPPQKE